MCVCVCLPCLCLYVDSAGRNAVVCTGSGLCPHSLTCQLVNSGKGSDLPCLSFLIYGMQVLRVPISWVCCDYYMSEYTESTECLV